MSESSVKTKNKRQNDEKDEENDAVADSAKKVSIRQIFSHCSAVDYLLFIFGFVVVIFVGFNWTIFNVIFGKIVDTFSQFERQYNNQTAKGEVSNDLVPHFMSTVFFWSGLMMAFGVWHIFSNLLAMSSFQFFALRRMRTIKRLYLEGILQQEVAWFDRQASGEFASRISGDFKKFEAGINENLAMLIFHFSSIFTCLAVGLFYGWKLSLAILVLTPIKIASSILCSKLQTKLSKREMEASSKASSVAEEATGAIRTVFAFGGEAKERARYERAIKPAMTDGIKRNFISAIDNSIGWASMYAGLAIGVWYGVRLIAEESYSLADLVIVYFSITSCGYNIGYCAPYLESFKTARAAAVGIFEVIERKSAIDSSSNSGEKLGNGYRADIELKNVHFSYPTRADVPVLNGLSLKVAEGETVGLVGASGCGKSTVVQLMQRFYEPEEGAGQVLLSGHDIRSLNPGWLRQQIGTVGQEPVLFDATVEENIRLGAPVERMSQLTIEDIIKAAKEANAHEFISGLEKGYQTYVGDRGAQLSGGQKQRIAIARALISKPRILLLDEATSALDLRSESIVQAALDRARQGRTTLIIAHRLSTIRAADRIVVLENGLVQEEGTHEQLMEQQSVYYNLVKAQEVIDSDSALHESTSKAEFELLNQAGNENKAKVNLNTSHDVANLKNSDELEKKIDTPHLRLFKLIWLDRVVLLIALFCAIIYGFGTPIYALIFGSFVEHFSTSSSDKENLNSLSMIYTLLFAGLAAFVFFVNLTQVTLFGVVGERLTMRLRLAAFEAILRQKVGWFDAPENSTGALCSRLADDAASVQGATGLRVATVCQAVSCFFCCLVIGFYFNWRLAVVSLALMPLLVAASMLSTKLNSGEAEDDSQTAADSGRLLVEVINAVRTVVGLHKERYFIAKFVRTLEDHFLARKGRILMKGLLLSSVIAAPFFAYAVTFAYGGWLLSKRYITSGDFFRIAECMIFGAFMIGETAVLSADYGKAKVAAFHIFKLIDESPKEEEETTSDRKKRKEVKSQGEVTFNGVHFSYPNRSETEILSGLSFSAKKGETVALVGASGCGKSTSLQLLERFYDCTQGTITLDGEDISQLSVDCVRSQMSLVSQEPVLFSYSIAENIAYGDNSRKVVPFEEIVRAAQSANVHDFVNSLPEAYNTRVGGKGSLQLSGGQKQRIAIARALLRKPAVLALDEATSALDTASEKVVQEALEEASKGRTCIVIAHRLKTIVSAHRIVVIDKGQNVEEGTHEELIAKRGHYWKLYNSPVT